MDTNKQNISFFKFYFGLGSSFSKIFFALTAIILVISSITHLFEEIIIGVCIDYIQENEIKKLKTLCSILIMMGVLNGLLEILVGFLFKKHGEKFSYTYKKNYYSLVLNQDYDWFVKKDLNELSESIKNDVISIEGASGKKLYYFGSNILWIPVILLMFFLMSWKVSIAILPLILLIFIITYFYQLDLIKLTDENISFSSSLSSFLSDFYSKFRTIKFFGNYDHEKDLFHKIIKENYDINTSYGWLYYFFVNSIFIVNYTIISLVILIGSYLIVTNRFHKNESKLEGTIVNFDLGQIITFIITAFYLNIVSREYLLLTKNISYGKESAQNYYNLLDETEKKAKQMSQKNIETSELKILDSGKPVDEIKLIGVYLNYFSNEDENPYGNPKEIRSGKSDSTVLNAHKNGDQENESLIEFSERKEKDLYLNVSESLNKKKYNKENHEDKYALKNINLVFSKSKINYLIGKTGSGKTSILSIITKLFKPTKGEIFLNENNIHDLDKDYYLGLIGYVPQESLFYNISIRENIRFFRDDVTDRDVEYICDFLKMDFLRNYKDGLDSKMGHNGSELSGGQKQLISLARALVKKPKILLLDEFTSNMDNILTSEISKILNQLVNDMIVVVVTHKIKLINLEDKINNLVVLDSGKIVNNNDILNKEINNLEQYLSNDSDENIFEKNNSDSHSSFNYSEEESFTTHDSRKNSNNNINSRFTIKQNRESHEQDLAIFEFEESHEHKRTLYELIWIDNKREICILIIQYVISSILNASNGILIYYVNKSLSLENEAEMLYNAKLICGFYIFYGIIYTILQTLQMGKSEKITHSFILNLRKELFNRFINYEIAHLRSFSKNDFIKFFIEDITILGPMITNYVGLFFEVILTLLFGLIIAIYFEWRIGLICLGTMSILYGFLYAYYKFNFFGELEEEEVVDYFTDTIKNIKLLKVLNLKDKLMKFLINYEKNLKTKNSNSNKMICHYMNGLYWVFDHSLISLIFYIGGIFVLEKKIIGLHNFYGSLTFLFFYILYYNLLCKYIFEIVLIKNTLSKLNDILDDDKNQKMKNNIIDQSEMSNLKNNCLNEVTMETEDHIYGSKEDFGKEKSTNYNSNPGNISCFNFCGIRNQQIHGKIEFKNVSFSYSQKNKNLVLNKVSFTILPGTKVGFVGVSGSGKSTIVQLLLRFYEPNEGEIFLDNRNIKEYDFKVLRNYFSGVLQEPELFERSIFENIQYGRLDSTKKDIEYVSKLAEVPMNLVIQEADTNQNVSQISGGQKQRIAIARSLLRDRSIYVFDEATSALDAKTEKKINSKLNKFFSKMQDKKTIIIVAHRLINVRECDKIYVMRESKIVESGNHSELISKNGEYYKLHQTETVTTN